MQYLAVQKKTFPILFLGFIALFSYAYYPSIQDLWLRWNQFDGSYSHGILVLCISAYYLFFTFKSSPVVTLTPIWQGLILLFGSSVLWLLAYYASIEAIQQLLLPWIIWLFCYSLLGWTQSKQILFPIGFLYFAIPFWDVLTVPLQYITTDVNGFLLSLAGIEAHIEDVFVTLSVGKFEIAGGCSGLRYLVISITLTSLYSYLNYSRAKSAAILIISGIAIALIANWIRVFIIILAGHATNMEHSLINDHDNFGWLVFAVTLVPLFFLANKLERSTEDNLVDNSTPNTQQPTNEHSANSTLFPAIFYVILVYTVAFSAPFYAKFSIANNRTSNVDIEITVDSSLGVWKRSYLKNNLISPPLFQSPDGKYDAIYSNGQNNIQLSVRSYVQQAPGKELINYNNRLYDQDLFINTNSGRLNGSDYNFNYVIIKNNNDDYELVSYQYLVSYLATSNRILAKLLEIIRPLIGSPESTLIYTRMRCEKNCTDEQQFLKEFINSHYQQITHFLYKTNHQ